MKKSIVISLLTVTTLLCTALCSFASTGIVTTDTLRVRKEASTDSAIVALLSIDDKVEILEEQNGWYKVKFGEDEGYVAAQYINSLDYTNSTETVPEENVNAQEDNTATQENTNTEESNTEQNTNQEQTGTQEESSQDVPQNANTVKVLAKGQKLYITPLINSLAIHEITEEKQIEIVSETNGWCYVKAGTQSGWVRTESIQSKEVENGTSNTENNNSSSQTYGYISGSSVNFRKTPNTSGEVITKLMRNTKVTVIQKGDTWTEIEFEGNKGYVSTEYVSDKELETTTRSAAPRTAKAKTNSVAKNQTRATTQNNNASSVAPETKQENVASTAGATREAVVSYARQYLGYRYKSGGASPSSGFDCSGFTTYIFKHFGISLSRTSGGQSGNGVAVSKGNMIPGDIICFSNSSSSKRIGHVGIYIGGGKFIHSANSRQGVIISNVDGAGFYFVTARRVI